MSTLSLRKIKHDSSAVDNVTLDSSGNTGFGISTPGARVDISVPSGINARLTKTSGAYLEYHDGTVARASISGLAGADGLSINTGTAHTERVRVDASGRVTMPYQPAFTAYGGADASGTTSAIIWTLTELNRGGYYNTSNGRFTCPIAGVYVFHYRWLTNASQTLQPRLFKNGSGIEGATQYANPSAGEYYAGEISVAIQCNASDYITCGTLSGILYQGPNYNSGFSGYLLG